MRINASIFKKNLAKTSDLPKKEYWSFWKKFNKISYKFDKNAKFLPNFEILQDLSYRVSIMFCAHTKKI